MLITFYETSLQMMKAWTWKNDFNDSPLNRIAFSQIKNKNEKNSSMVEFLSLFYSI
jgi:hypothetical protein